jgi:hypothetical protein
MNETEHSHRTSHTCEQTQKKKRSEDSYESHHYNCDQVDKCHP